MEVIPTTKPKIDYKAKIEITNSDIEQLIKNISLIKFLPKVERSINSIANWQHPSKNEDFLSKEQLEKIYETYNIKLLNSSKQDYSPYYSFKSLGFPPEILKALDKRGFALPTPIQMIGISAVLSGVDMIAVSPSGSGKSLVYILPSVMLAYYEESKQPIIRKEGPFVIIIVPSRELAIQIHESIKYFFKHIMKNNDIKLRSTICIGGIDIKFQIEDIEKGTHIVIGTPGRLSDLLERKKLDTSFCKLLIFDETERLLDWSFDEELAKVMIKFKKRKQTLFFSNSLPNKLQNQMSNQLYKPIIINISDNLHNLNVVQNLEYVKDEGKLLNILPSLQKTAPPVVIFCESKTDIDEIHEYLLLKGIDVAAIHGDKDQEDRIRAIREFQAGLKDILVSTDIINKGIELPAIEHVINYDLPKDLDTYILRISKAASPSQIGVSTTFINRNADHSLLVELKHFLYESKMTSNIPQILLNLPDKKEAKKPCLYCESIYHEVHHCHKLDSQRLKRQITHN